MGQVQCKRLKYWRIRQAQEKNITYPTDAKQALKVSELCLKIADRHQLPLRRSYRYTLPKLKCRQHNGRNPKRVKQARKALKSLRTIAGCLLRELERNLNEYRLDLTGKHGYEKRIALFYRVLGQQRTDKNKIYSLHEPETACIAKGKAHKKYVSRNIVTTLERSKTYGSRPRW